MIPANKARYGGGERFQFRPDGFSFCKTGAKKNKVVPKFQKVRIEKSKMFMNF